MRFAMLLELLANLFIFPVLFFIAMWIPRFLMFAFPKLFKDKTQTIIKKLFNTGWVISLGMLLLSFFIGLFKGLFG